MAAASVEPPDGVCVEDVVEGVEENDSVIGYTDGAWGQCMLGVRAVFHRDGVWVLTRFERQPEGRALFLNGIWISVEEALDIGKGRRGVVGNAARGEDEILPDNLNG